MEGSPTQLPKRFYKSVSFQEGDHGWHVQLDGRTPVTPAKKALAVPTEPLARALAEEWDEQEKIINLPLMTLTRMANVALDRTPHTRADLIAEVRKYADTDLVCYLADGPTELRDRQEAHFAPLRDWISREHGVELKPTETIINIHQPEESLDAVARYAANADDFTLTGLAMAVGLFSSAVLAIAVAEGELQATDAYDMSRIEELWQIEQWGEDDEAMAKVAAQRREVEKLGVWFASLKPPVTS